MKHVNTFEKFGGEPRHQNYMFFQNLKQIKEHVEEMLEMDPEELDEILSEHGWAVDHIATSKDDIEEVYNFLEGQSVEEIDDMDKLEESVIPDRYKNMGFTKVGAKKKSNRPGKKWMVLAKKGDKFKVVHGGDNKMEDYTQHRDPERRKRFWDRMGGKNSAKAKDPFSPLYWHKRFRTW